MINRFNFNRLAHFVAIVDEGTITGAAKVLGISKAVVSKQLQLLEDDIGTPLFVRNTRRLKPTEAGLQFYQDAKSALALAANAYERVQERDKKPKGVLRVTAPVDFGVYYLVPLVARFQNTFSDVFVDLHLTDKVVDIINDRYDLAFRIGWLEDSSNRARKLMEFEQISVCSPKTAARIEVNEPQDLSSKPFVLASAFSGKSSWKFSKKNTSQIVPTKTVAEINLALALKAYVTEGFCFTVLPDILIKQELESGELVRLLPDWSVGKGGVYTVTPSNRIRSNALQAFLKTVYEQLGT